MSGDTPKTIWITVIATVVSAIITSGGFIIAHNWDDFYHLIRGVKTTSPPEEDGKRIGLGALQELEPETVYHAETDGFVMAFTGGNNPANLATILMGTGPGSLTYCSRMLRYDGATCPVPQGSYWIVRDYEKAGGTITVRWIPLIQ